MNVMAKQKYTDFGDQVGGARKEIWNQRVTLENEALMSNKEKEKFIEKNRVWPQPDYLQMIAEGEDLALVYWKKTVRDAVSKRPRSYQEKDIHAYISLCNDLENLLAEPEMEDPDQFIGVSAMEFFHENEYVTMLRQLTEKGKGAKLTNKLLRALRGGYRHTLLSKAQKRDFGLTKEEKLLKGYDFLLVGDNIHVLWDEERGEAVVEWPMGDSTVCRKYSVSGTLKDFSEEELKKFFVKDTWAVLSISGLCFVNGGFSTKEDAQKTMLSLIEAEKKRKKSQTKKQVPDQLLNIHRVGYDWHGPFTVSQTEFEKKFHPKRVDYGNYVPQKERGFFMTHAFDAFCDLQYILNISPDDVFFNNRLVLGIGSRGTGGKNAGMATYTPFYEAINLTRKKGAGSLGHEWMHALDHQISQFLKGETLQLYSEIEKRETGPIAETYRKLKQAMKTKMTTEEEGRQIYEDRYLLERDNYEERFECIPGDSNKEKYSHLVDKTLYLIDNTTISNIQEKDNMVETIYKIWRTEASPSIASQMYWWIRNVLDAKINLNSGEYIFKTDTSFYKNALLLDKGRSRLYYSSDVELFARAGEAWLASRLEKEGMRNSFLCGTAESKTTKALPHGKEREAIGKIFDQLLEQCKELQLLHSFEQEINKPIIEYSVDVKTKKEERNVLQEGKKVEKEDTPEILVDPRTQPKWVYDQPTFFDLTSRKESADREER